MRKRKRAMEPSKQKQNQRIQKGGQQKQTLILIHFHMWHDHVNNVSHYFREFEWGREEGGGAVRGRGWDQQEMVNQKLKATTLSERIQNKQSVRLTGHRKAAGRRRDIVGWDARKGFLFYRQTIKLSGDAS